MVAATFPQRWGKLLKTLDKLTCQQRCEINIYVYNKYLFHKIVSTLPQRYAMTQHLSNVV